LGVGVVPDREAELMFLDERLRPFPIVRRN
jgi:hypothetical protein